jgi:putative hydrolase of the HAD superfamily
MKKPHRRIYEHALNALHIIDPTEAVFVDDTLANLTAPQEMGMHTIHVLSPEQAVSDLTRLLHL